MQALIKFLFIALAIIWLLRLIARLLFPWAVRKATQKMRDHAQQFQDRAGQQQAYRQQRPSQAQPDGKVRIDYIPPKQKPKMDVSQGGDFVEFEEVK